MKTVFQSIHYENYIYGSKKSLDVIFFYLENVTREKMYELCFKMKKRLRLSFARNYCFSYVSVEQHI